MILIVCMAGFNTRFHNAGFDVPKYLLPWDNGVIISGILDALNANASFDRVILLANRRDKYFKDELIKAVSPFGINDDDIVYIPDTRGQAHTAAIGAQFVTENNSSPSSAIAFHNADTILVGRDIKWVRDQLLNRDVFVDVFPASSPAYSYVGLQESRVVRIKEKIVISPFASSGFYGFQSASAYLKAFDKHSQTVVDTLREIYISDVISTMISDGADVFINELQHDANTIVLGKPEEYGLEVARKAMFQ